MRRMRKTFALLLSLVLLTAGLASNPAYATAKDESGNYYFSEAVRSVAKIASSYSVNGQDGKIIAASNKRKVVLGDFVVKNKLYDGTTDAEVYGVEFKDEVDNSMEGITWECNDAAFETPSIGTGKTVTGTIALTGEADEAYELESGAFSATADIYIDTNNVYLLWVGGTQVTNANAEDVLGDGTASYDADVNTLALSGINLTSGGIKYLGSEKLTIDLSNDNAVSGSDNGIYSMIGDIEITGGGNLTAEGSSYGIHANNWDDVQQSTTQGAGNIVIKSGTVTATGGQYSGIRAEYSVRIEGGAVNATGNGDFYGSGIVTDGAGGVTITGGSVTAEGTGSDSYGILAYDRDVAIQGGEVTATGKTQGIYGSVKNAILGTGWTNTAGTEGESAIAISADGQTLSYLKVQFPQPSATVKTPPKAIEGLVEDSSEQELVTAGTAEGGTLQYALGTATEPTEPYDASVPTGTKAGTYHVWYRAVGDETHADSEAKRVTAAIREPGRVPIYRMYNHKTSEHLYTTNEAEYSSCGKGAYKDWRAEGVEWLAPAKGQEGARPVRRLYNKGLGDHHYAAEVEAKLLVESHGWVDEGIAFYTMDEGSAPLGLHRLYNPGLTRGQHHYTASGGEAKALVSQHGWVDEGMAFWGWEPAA